MNKVRSIKRANRHKLKQTAFGTKHLPPNRLERFAYSMEKNKLLDYLEFTRKPHWLILRNFAIGAARGVGLTVGTALVIALALKLLQNVISMNIPYLTDMLVDFVRFVKSAATSVPGATDAMVDASQAAATVAAPTAEGATAPLTIDKSLAN